MGAWLVSKVLMRLMGGSTGVLMCGCSTPDLYDNCTACFGMGWEVCRVRRDLHCRDSPALPASARLLGTGKQAVGQAAGLMGASGAGGRWDSRVAVRLAEERENGRVDSKQGQYASLLRRSGLGRQARRLVFSTAFHGRCASPAPPPVLQATRTCLRLRLQLLAQAMARTRTRPCMAHSR